MIVKTHKTRTIGTPSFHRTAADRLCLRRAGGPLLPPFRLVDDSCWGVLFLRLLLIAFDSMVTDRIRLMEATICFYIYIFSISKTNAMTLMVELPSRSVVVNNRLGVVQARRRNAKIRHFAPLLVYSAQRSSNLEELVPRCSVRRETLF